MAGVARTPYPPVSAGQIATGSEDQQEASDLKRRAGRVERVLEIVEQNGLAAEQVPEIEKFCGGVFVRPQGGLPLRRCKRKPGGTIHHNKFEIDFRRSSTATDQS